ncbi:MAG: hypothetical protein HGA96_01730 [Desulfobulbaceae bacterium]|nr:hypothetical protein [Desulfobulbaceae bacterium]
MEMDREEAMARIRAEIMASDWRLNRRRIEALRVALAAVEVGNRGRKAFRYLLEMARAALDYQEKRDEDAPPMVLDFLKQALAQVIAVSEEEQISLERETEIFNKVHLAFIALKRRLAGEAGITR